jgi:hypothetical protein
MILKILMILVCREKVTEPTIRDIRCDPKVMDDGQ